MPRRSADDDDARSGRGDVKRSGARATSDDIRDWRLSAGSLDAERLTGIELSIERLVAAYQRWKAICASLAGADALTAEDVSVLNSIGAGVGRISEIARLFNRTDVPNIQYAVRKLMRLDLVEKDDARAAKTTSYQLTGAGREVAAAYAALRDDILVPLAGGPIGNDTDSARLRRALDELSGVYAQGEALAIGRVGRKNPLARGSG